MCAKCGVWEACLFQRNGIWIHAFHWGGKSQKAGSGTLGGRVARDLCSWVLGKGSDFSVSLAEGLRLGNQCRRSGRWAPGESGHHPLPCRAHTYLGPDTVCGSEAGGLRRKEGGGRGKAGRECPGAWPGGAPAPSPLTLPGAGGWVGCQPGPFPGPPACSSLPAAALLRPGASQRAGRRRPCPPAPPAPLQEHVPTQLKAPSPSWPAGPVCTLTSSGPCARICASPLPPVCPWASPQSPPLYTPLPGPGLARTPLLCTRTLWPSPSWLTLSWHPPSHTDTLPRTLRIWLPAWEQGSRSLTFHVHSPAPPWLFGHWRLRTHPATTEAHSFTRAFHPPRARARVQELTSGATHLPAFCLHWDLKHNP